jgi:transketolase
MPLLECHLSSCRQMLEGKATTGELLEKSVNTIRFLAIHVVEKANSGRLRDPFPSHRCCREGQLRRHEALRFV